MDTDDIDSEFSIIDGLSSDDESSDVSTDEDKFSAKLACKTFYNKVSFHFIHLEHSELTIKFSITCKKLVPLPTDAIWIVCRRYTDKCFKIISEPSNKERREYTISFKEPDMFIAGEYKLEYISNNGTIVDYAFFNVHKKRKESDSKSDDGITADDFDDLGSIINWKSFSLSLNDEEDNAPDVANSAEDITTKSLRDLKVKEQLETVENLEEQLKNTQECYICEQERSEELTKNLEELHMTSSTMKKYIRRLERQMIKEKRNLDGANKYANDLRSMLEDTRKTSMDENKRLRKKLNSLRKREALLIQPKTAVVPSDTDVSTITNASGVSTSSLSEISIALEQKMDIIASNFAEQFSQMQESIGKLLPERKMGELKDAKSAEEMPQSMIDENAVISLDDIPNSMTDENAAKSPVEILSSMTNENAADAPEGEMTDENALSDDTTVTNDPVANYYDQMRTPLCPSAPTENYSITSGLLSETSDLFGNLSLAEESSETETQLNSDESTRTESSFFCSLCDYKCEGDYYNIADHFNSNHMDKKCPLCAHTVPCHQDEQLNCHVQAHLDEEDAKGKRGGGWIFSQLTFD